MFTPVQTKKQKHPIVSSPFSPLISDLSMSDFEDLKATQNVIDLTADEEEALEESFKPKKLKLTRSSSVLQDDIELGSEDTNDPLGGALVALKESSDNLAGLNLELTSLTRRNQAGGEGLTKGEYDRLNHITSLLNSNIIRDRVLTDLSLVLHSYFNDS
jgi:NACalpha-BTF3-like transcription factor